MRKYLSELWTQFTLWISPPVLKEYEGDEEKHPDEKGVPE